MWVRQRSWTAVDQTVATLVNWGNHPEVLDDDNLSHLGLSLGTTRRGRKRVVLHGAHPAGSRMVHLQGTVGGP